MAKLETLDATLAGIRFHKPSLDNPSGIPFLIASTTEGQTVKGAMRRPIIGESYTFYGQWKEQKNGYPAAFEFLNFEIVVKSSIFGVGQFLARYIDGLGAVKAKRLAEHFGVECVRILRETPERAAEVRGIPPESVEAIKQYFQDNAQIDPAAYAELIDMFATAEMVVPRRIVDKLMQSFGSDAPNMVRENPYMLLAYPRFGWKKVDSFATTACGYPADGIGRHKHALAEAMNELALNGHTVADRVEIESLCFSRFLNRRPREDAWAAATIEIPRLLTPVIPTDPKFLPLHRMTSEEIAGNLRELDKQGVKWMLTKYEIAERQLAQRIAFLMENVAEIPFDLTSDRLNDDQKEAAKLIQRTGFGIIGGSPGVGKTWTVTTILRQFVDNGFGSILCVAPTGKAAKRLSELLDAAIPGSMIPCLTIHKALGPQPSDEEEGIPQADAKLNRGRDSMTFTHDSHDFLPYDVVVIDEASMMDAVLANCLFQAVAPGTVVIIVGDYNQLPSIRPGAVLRDMIDVKVPSITLDKIVRSDGGGRIVRACHDIKDGRIPQSAVKAALPTENWVHVEIDEPPEIAAFIADRIKQTKTFKDVYWDYQVIGAQISLPHIGTAALNELLADRLNPDPNPASSQNGKKPPFRVGDKVIRTKNGQADRMSLFDPHSGFRVDWRWDDQDWTIEETSIVNGDMGVVKAIVPHEKGTHVVVKLRNPDQLVRLPYDECHLERGFAITCHKAQGSGFPYVIVPIHSSFYWNNQTNTGIFSREWFYTALSRAEIMLLTVGQRSAWSASIGRRTINQRRTTLGPRLKLELASLAKRRAERESVAEEPENSFPELVSA